MTRRAARVDMNQDTIIQALLSAGAVVQSLAPVGVGCPDLLVGYGGTNYLIEVKNPGVDPNQRRLTRPQVKFHAWWKQAGQVAIAETPKQALEVIGAE